MAKAKPEWGRGTDEPHPVDIFVGNRLHELRRARGVTQQELAEQLKITFQQVQKYETGVNRISAGRLLLVAQLFNLPVGFFFDGLPDTITKQGVQVAMERAISRDQMILIQCFRLLPADELRASFLALVKACAAEF